MSSRDRLSIKLLGATAVSYQGEVLRIGRKQGALVAYLALSPQGYVSRDRLVGMMWSCHPARSAKRNLRQMLKNLRDLFTAVGFPGLEVHDTQHLRLQPDAVDIDVKEVMDFTATLDLPRYLLEQKKIHESLLQDFEGIDEEYDNWILLQRHTLRDRLTLQLENALSQTAGIHTRDLASALHNLDPSNEVAVRALMCIYARENNYGGALSVYATVVELLNNEYGMDPTEETEALAVDIKLADSSAQTGDDPPGYAEPIIETEVPPYLLIEKFTTDLLPQDKVHVANGFRHDLLASLARFRDWRVVEQSLQLESAQTNVQCGKRYLLRAHAYMDGLQLKLVFTVLDAGNGIVVWSQKYGLRMESWLITQKQIIRKLAVALNINLSADRLNNISRHRELPAALHDRWLLGQYHLFCWNPQSSKKAQGIFKSICIDAPSFAPAYSSLVQLENSRHLVFPGMRRKSADDTSTIDLARQAVQTDPLDSKTHLSMAWSLCLSHQFEDAMRYYDSAIELNENDPWTLVSAAQGYSFCSEYSRAALLVAEADELGLSFNQLYCAYQVGTKFLYGDYRGAIEAAEKAGDIISNIRAWKSSALALLNLYDSAIEEGQKFLALNRSNWHGPTSSPTDAEIVDWFLCCFPIRCEQDWTALRDGLAKAQLPIPDSISNHNKMT